MEILRVFNNNVVLARDDGGSEVILTGRGLGFQARPGQPVDPAKVVRTFVPADGRDPDHLAELLAGIRPEHIALVDRAMRESGMDTSTAGSPTLMIALADHINFALHRLAANMHVAYPLLAEVKNLYTSEYAQGAALLAAINARLPEPLPDGEAVALTLHIVNAGFTSGDLTYTYQMTGIIQQMMRVIEQTYDIELDPSSVNSGRFVTHLRYLFVRIHQGRQLDDTTQSVIGAAIRDAYPQAFRCAQRLAAILELRLGSPLTEDEVSYLTLHVARVATDKLQ